MAEKKIAIMVDQMYQVLEVWYPYYRLKEEGLHVDFVAAEPKKEYPSKEGYPCLSTVSAGQVAAADYDCMIVPGGFAPDFLAYYLNSSHGRAWIRSVVSQQVGQANVNGSKLRALRIPLPPGAEQHRIVAEVERRLSVIEELENTTGCSVQVYIGTPSDVRQAIDRYRAAQAQKVHPSGEKAPDHDSHPAEAPKSAPQPEPAAAK